MVISAEEFNKKSSQNYFRNAILFGFIKWIRSWRHRWVKYTLGISLQLTINYHCLQFDDFMNAIIIIIGVWVRRQHVTSEFSSFDSRSTSSINFSYRLLNTVTNTVERCNRDCIDYNETSTQMVYIQSNFYQCKTLNKLIVNERMNGYKKVSRCLLVCSHDAFVKISIKLMRFRTNIFFVISIFFFLARVMLVMVAQMEFNFTNSLLKSTKLILQKYWT